MLRIVLGDTWRFVDTGPLDGPRNMAIDQALLDSFDPDRSPPVLRLYGWSPPALSFGRFQDAGTVLDLDRCRAQGVCAVRRMTGGGIIYHADELTYAVVCAPRHLPPRTTVKGSFRFLTGFLLAFYRGLGLPAAYAADALPAAEGLGRPTAFCFAGCEASDIVIEGRKIGGNAQRRLRNAVFQHGSVPLRDQSATGIAFLRERPDGAAFSAGSLASFGVRLPEGDLKVRLAVAFAATLEAVLVPDGLTPVERDRADNLAAPGVSSTPDGKAGALSR